MTIKLTLSIEDIDNDIVEYVLSAENDSQNGFLVWKKSEEYPVGIEYDLTIKTLFKNDSDELEKIEILRKGQNIDSTDDEIRELFAAAYLELVLQRKIDQADGLEHEHDTNRNEQNDIDQNPYDPKLIRVDTKPFSIHQVIDMICDGDIDLSPDFQREFVWLDITRKSRLIESLLLRIPLPVFYLAQDEDGKFRVVDGVQRLTVINDFVNNKFKLKNMEYLKECDGQWYKNPNRRSEENLQQIYIRRIDQTQLFFNIIDPQTPERVKYDIFRRINTGGKTLNRQEIRNCLESSHVRNFVKKLSHSEAFLNATRHSISATRMADNEMVLRFIAFYFLDHHLFCQIDYKGDMDYYLDHTVEILNKLSTNDFDLIEKAFVSSMNNAYYLFGDRAFRKANYINKSLFLSWTRVLSNYDICEIERKCKDYILLKRLEDEINKNDEYKKAISMATNDVKNVNYSFQIANNLLKEYL